MRNQKGITLISLIITIIVMIILAAVSITTLVGEGSVVEKAISAKVNTEEASRKEEEGLVNLENVISNYVGPSSNGGGTSDDANNGGCITADTPIIVSLDGKTKMASELEIGDNILTINPLNGEYELKPIIFVTKEEVKNVNIANIKFNDQSNLKIYSGHRLFNIEENGYPNIAVKRIDEYIGKNYAKIKFDNSNIKIFNSEIVSYKLENYSGYVYDFVTEINLNYFANNFATCSVAMLGFPFTYKTPMVIDYDEYLINVESYGLISYEECCEYIGGVIPKKIFSAINAERLKIAISKGYLTESALKEGIERMKNGGVFQ